jgi:diguanylate cyclase (GGDEF)-like protein
MRSGEVIASLVRRADEALYVSKNAGRNCAHFHNGTNCELIGEKRRDQTDTTARQTARQTGSVQAHDGSPSAGPAQHGTPDRNSAPSTGQETTRQPGRTLDAHIDPLTGFPTREVLRENLRRRIAEWRRLRVPLALVVIALDNHERIEALGSKASDFAVDTIAKLLMAACRTMDFVVRSGEHQFTIMLPNCSLTNALVPAERVRKAVAACEKLKYQGTTVWFTVSAGVAEVTVEDDEDSLFQRAEMAMNAASTEGNGTYVHTGSAVEPTLSTVEV